MKRHIQIPYFPTLSIFISRRMAPLLPAGSWREKEREEGGRERRGRGEKEEGGRTEKKGKYAIMQSLYKDIKKFYVERY